MKEDAGGEGSEEEERLCGVGRDIWESGNEHADLLRSLSAVPAPTANEMTSITQRTTKPVGYCLHSQYTVSHKRSASWTGGGGVGLLPTYPTSYQQLSFLPVAAVQEQRYNDRTAQWLMQHAL